MRHMFERAGDRILRLALSERKASACGWTSWSTVWYSSSTTLQRRINTCNNAQQCRVSINGAPYQSATCP